MYSSKPKIGSFCPCSYILLSSLLPSLILLGQCAVRSGNLKVANESSHRNEVTELYLGVAFSKDNEAVITRAVNRTLALLTSEIAVINLSLTPLYIALPDSFSAKLLSDVYATWKNKSVLALLVLASNSASFMTVMAANDLGIPVLWATGEVADGYLNREPLNPMEIYLDPGAQELFIALRSLLLTTHWHSFSFIYTNLPFRKEIANILLQPPLLPHFLPLNTEASPNAIFRLLSDISRSTKGVVLLMCDGYMVKRIVTEGQRLNMLEGNFVWLWIDTSASITSRNETKSMTHNLQTTNVDTVKIKTERKTRDTELTKQRTSDLLNTGHFKFLGNHSADRILSEKLVIDKLKIDSVNQNILNKSKSNMYSEHSINSNLKDNSQSYYDPFNKTPISYNKTDCRNLIQQHGVTKSIKNLHCNSSLHNQINKNNFTLKVINGNYKNINTIKNVMKIKNLYKRNPVSNYGLFSFNEKSLFSIKNLPKSENSIFIKQLLTNSSNVGEVQNIYYDNVINHTRNYNISYFSTNKLLNFKDVDINCVNNYTIFRMCRLHNLSKSNKTVIKQSDSSLRDHPIVTRSTTNLNRNKPDLMKKTKIKKLPHLPIGLLAVQAVPLKLDRHLVRNSIKIIFEALKHAVVKVCNVKDLTFHETFTSASCWKVTNEWQQNFKKYFFSELKTDMDSTVSTLEGEKTGKVFPAKFQILNLVPDRSVPSVQDTPDNKNKEESTSWRPVGEIIGRSVHLDTVIWPGGELVPVSTARGVRSVFRVVTALAPPFVMEGELDEDGHCLRGLECHRLLTSDKDNLTLLFNEMERLQELESETEAQNINEILNRKHVGNYERIYFSSLFKNPKYLYKTNCCYGLSMDLLENIAQELEFDFHLYIVSDGKYGSQVLKENGEVKWNGIIGDLVSGAAHMSFAALSVSSPRSQVIDFSVPYFFSGVSFLAAPRQRTDIPLLAFLLPFSPELWIAIFTSLNVTAVAVAIYEWLSPFGLNPWGRQRSKNFSMSSALWVCWGLLCGHLVAFKAPKSWPNKFLINVWGGFSVIFVASYTANIAALIAGLFFHNAVGDYHDRSLLSQRVGTPRASAADYYIHRANQLLWEHMQKYSVKDVEEGVQHLKNGSLDILIADTPILDYYRATDHGCKLQKIGDAINEDTYAVGMTKGFPLKDSISAVIAKYSSNGYMDILQEKWYGGLPCFKLATDMAQPRPLGVAAVTGVFLLLGMGMIVGCLILIMEHLFYKYTLPILRHKPKGTIWKSRNIMFFSQKLYRFINCVELVSPHHAARELVHTLRQGQITSLFQKSVKRKEHEQRRRRKSKAQFFEMIQEIRRVQQEEKVNISTLPHISLPDEEKSKSSPRLRKLHLTEHRRHSRLDLARRLSKDVFRSKSSSNLNIRRFSTDINMAAGRFLDCHSSQAIGRRLSRDTNPSPPDINSRRASHFSDYRKLSSQFLAPNSDIECSSNISTPKSSKLCIPTFSPTPTLSDLKTSTLPDFKTSTKFSYVDIRSPSFKNKLLKFKDNSTVDNGNLKLTVHQDNTNVISSNEQNNWLNNVDSTAEHLIEIIIPDEDDVKKEVTNNELSGAGECLRTSGNDFKPSMSDQFSALPETHGQFISNSAKPKIVSYLPKKIKKGNLEMPLKILTGNTNQTLSSSDTVIKVDLEKPTTNNVEYQPTGECTNHERGTKLSKRRDIEVFSRLTKDELLILSEMSQEELKNYLLEAIHDKDPT